MMTSRCSVIACFSILPLIACSQHSSQSDQADTVTSPKLYAEPIKKVVQPQYKTLNDLEDSFADFASACSKRTTFQRENTTPSDWDFGPKLVGRQYRFTGKVHDIRREGDDAVIEIRYRLKGSALAVRESGQRLQKIIYNEKEYRERRSWTIIIKPNRFKTKRNDLLKLSKRSLVSIDAVVDEATGFKLVDDGARGVYLQSNKQTITATAVSDVNAGQIGHNERVLILFDKSGSMSEGLDAVKPISQRIVKHLKPTNQFNIIAFSDGHPDMLNKDRMISATPTKKQVAFNFLDGIVPEGKSDPTPAIKIALDQRPNTIFWISDFDTGPGMFVPFHGRQKDQLPAIHLLKVIYTGASYDESLATSPFVTSVTEFRARQKQPISTAGDISPALLERILDE